MHVVIGPYVSVRPYTCTTWMLSFFSSVEMRKAEGAAPATRVRIG
jgi:hypothetical protein